jgi:hypothetical protein
MNAAANVRLNFSTGNERSSKGRAMAWPREDANHGDVHTSRPCGETRSLGIGGASELRSGRFKASDKLIAWLEADTFMSTKKPSK